ncbi:hypothetical protein CE91St65_12470 [[Clostridium] symbiosum]|uniref:Uncharacterized protein n=1 Tax=[Clostridium] symbiosum ATCC 14940 TaxID=411472 RepID=A0ABC9U405_CLOSY|nr:hypothetical protein CLOSYM_00151 [[Clostridium] symbiosum ATCC 14940]BDF23367.1 hypothetical protein CE91St65_12470 [[Clostridium] symbiosum]BDF28270.1 hypothetical protein CE91St66_12470 [[Clostridium] symbiosum]
MIDKNSIKCYIYISNKLFDVTVSERDRRNCLLWGKGGSFFYMAVKGPQYALCTANYKNYRQEV